MLDFAIVGGGGYALEHYKNIKTWGLELGCRVVAVAVRPQDRKFSAMDTFATDGVRVFDDAGEMMAALAGAIDGIIIPTSIDTHCELACRALDLGHNVYLEKPPAGTIQEVDAILSSARAAYRKNQVLLLGFQAIYSQSVNFIKGWVCSGRLGQVKRLRCWALWSRNDAYYSRNEWAGRLTSNGKWILDGPVNNALAHQTANLLYLASSRPREFAVPKSVRAEFYHARPIESEDTASIEIATAEGPLAYFVASHATAGIFEGPFIEMDCQLGQVHWQFDGHSHIRYADGKIETAADLCTPPKAALANFVEAARARDQGLIKCTVEMGRNFTLAVNGAFESARQTRPIPPELISQDGQAGQRRLVVEGLDQAIVRCGQEGKLFSDAGASWAVPTESFDLSGYEKFPTQFGKEG
jgi:predicted dehydrogenase